MADSILFTNPDNGDICVLTKGDISVVEVAKHNVENNSPGSFPFATPKRNQLYAADSKINLFKYQSSPINVVAKRQVRSDNWVFNQQYSLGGFG